MVKDEKTITTELPERISQQSSGSEHLIYHRRFNSAERKVREITWKILCRDFFQALIPTNACVIDLGAGDGLFIRNIKARRKIAVDLSDHVNALSGDDIEVWQIPASEMKSHCAGEVDIVFMSNFLEHLPNKYLLLEVIADCKSILRSRGRLIIMQPNIRYVGSAYWDYIDHHIALTEYSIVEALEVNGIEIEMLIPRFFPYTVKSQIGRFASGKYTEQLITLYLKFPMLWKLFGKQTLVLGKVP